MAAPSQSREKFREGKLASPLRRVLEGLGGNFHDVPVQYRGTEWACGEFLGFLYQAGKKFVATCKYTSAE